jgi:hypothetical protein
MQPTLVILAAGMGSRYGGLKQLEAVGPSGETIMDYTVYDAVRAGFGKVAFVIRRDMAEAFEATIGARYADHVPVVYAFQELEALPAGFTCPAERTKPWGTGHAVLAVADQVAEPFAVVNADDYYGRDAFATLAEFMQAHAEDTPPTFAMVAYELGKTMTEHGTVNRAVCQMGPDGWLTEMVETINIAKRGAEGVFTDEAGAEQTISGAAPVSMNCWGFTPALLTLLGAKFEAFLAENATSPKAEFYLPMAVREMIQEGAARVKVLTTAESWCGITHPEDKPQVEAHLRGLAEVGIYPAKLWG